MFERVILHGTAGPMRGQDVVLEDGTECVLGRSVDCSMCIADPLYLVSRHHCRIKVSAPLVRIQDLDSLNGTYVNGAQIGQRRKKQAYAETRQTEAAEYPLWQGDTLQLGTTVFQVEFDPRPPCAEEQARKPEDLWSSECLSACN